MTRVTVGMPACDSARTLARAIASVRGQTHADWRLVISDDASTDGTAALAEQAAAGDPRIALIRQPTRRGVMNFRAPLDAATTPLFVWLAADDWWDPSFLAATLATLDARPDAVSALPGVAWATAPGTVPGPPPATGTLDGPPADRARGFLSDPGGSRIYGLMRTDAARAAFPPGAIHAWDWAFMLGLLAQGPQVAVPGTLLWREETDWLAYAEEADADGGLFRSFPALAATRVALARGHVPRGALGALVRLNLSKHEEFVAVCRPATYARRYGLYRRLGLHFASSPWATATLMDRVADRNRTRDPARAAAAQAMKLRAQALCDLAGAQRRPPAPPPSDQGQTMAVPTPSPAAPTVRRQRALPPLTAVLAARNAEATLDRALAHLMRHGARVILIDHGSTDRTRTIADARRGAPVDRILDQPFDGTFDLAAQLDLKREVIAGLRDGWVIHADADEFLDPPPAARGATLAELAAGWPDRVLAASCDETAFLPATEDEVHHPDTFEATLTRAVPLRDHDPKQRLFRVGADLGLWRATGGHTITADPARMAPDRLALRHYPGLSLDHLRAQYLARVFARTDLARRWHTTRAAARGFDIVAPPAGALAAPGAATAPAQATLPVFAPRRADPAPPRPTGPVDLWIVCPDAAAAAPAADLARANFPGLRVEVTAAMPPAPAAVLHLLTHPAGAPDRDAACDWLRAVARARQDALTPGLRYAELRAEDLPSRAAALVLSVRTLLLGQPAGTDRLPRDGAPVARPCPGPATRAICTDMARDLGYAWAEAPA
jgi:glycosyltransferase involved in cell wall biosynthesis